MKIMLKKLRTARGLSQNQLAQQVGTTLQNIQKIEYGKTKGIQYEMLNKLCYVLQCQPGDLLEWVPDDDLDQQNPKPNSQKLEPDKANANSLEQQSSHPRKTRSFLNVVPNLKTLESA